MDEALDNDGIALVKGKRTKRQRSITVIDGSSPSTSSVEYYDTTEEEVEMANCLILLAQGNYYPKRPSVKTSATGDDDREYGRFTSRKYLEIDSGPGKIGYYVYECKTCNRTFRSFQALGGHRASHKKPKSTTNPPTVAVAIPLRDDEDQHDESKKYSSSLSLSLPLPIVNTININATNNVRKQGKVHECSICGAEFGSGQALGGHMRRHRAPPTTTPQIGIARLVESSLDLDLNLPAPQDRNAGNVFLLKPYESRSPPLTPPPPPSLGFSSPAMVDCHN